MLPLDRLRQLHLIAQQDQVASRHPHGNQIGRAHLTGFVDKEVVQLLSQVGVGKQPGRTSNQRRPRLPALQYLPFGVIRRDAAAGKLRFLRPGRGFFQPDKTE
ncbi:hypothetical protein D9M68_968370 [compost metagenome]